MITALVSLSRARRKELAEQLVPLRVLLGGHVIVSDVADIDVLHVAVDAVPVRELLDELGDGEPLEIGLAASADGVALRVAVPAELPRIDAPPVMALVRSLQYHAGTLVERLAVAQILLERQGGTLALDDDRVVIALPPTLRAER